ncbi:DUF58 domain-containing protein [Lignipirellula cremea]|uniref:VWFA domain-containing protein n=1 Tax=Lignipirellula cremea TaxID=2528010 RepID=A0A518E247_9BACT|nr:DUF58 domain-containing protein [Lignipirellula cremea]QDU98176.1 hypothetical protein Pla8534_60370 [Lignipirellula cremea]
MAQSLLNRYLSPDALNHLANRPIQPLELVIGNLAGAHKSPLSGFAVEFAGHREYSPGDDPKHVDWRVFYTRDKYFVKQYELETNFICHLVLDVSASMRYGEGYEQKLNFASRLAVTLGHAVVGQSDKVSLTTFDDKVRGYVSPSNAMSQIVRMAHHLDEISPVEKTAMGDCLHEFATRTGRREIVMIFSDFFTDLDELESVIQRMRYQRHEVVLFQILHHDELAFELEGMVKFVGLESDDDLLAQSEDLKASYLTAMRKFSTELEEVASRNRCEFVQVDTSRSMGEMLADYLNRRSRLNRGR